MLQKERKEEDRRTRNSFVSNGSSSSSMERDLQEIQNSNSKTGHKYNHKPSSARPTNPVKQTDNEVIGNLFQPAEERTFRIYYQNVNGISAKKEQVSGTRLMTPWQTTMSPYSDLPRQIYNGTSIE
jgi:hypothetical protein